MSRRAKADKVRCLPVAEWPARDRDLWHRLITPGSVFDDESAFVRLRPTTERNYARDWGRWLTFLEQSAPDALGMLPVERVNRERISAYVAELQSRNAASTVAQRIIGLEQVVRAMSPDCDWTWLRTLARRLNAMSTPTRDKATLVRSPAKIIESGIAIMEEAELRIDGGLINRARHYRNGLMLAFLASRPVRLGNFLAIRIGVHLRCNMSGFTLAFAGEETKNHSPLEFEISGELAERLERYISHWRPLLLKGKELDHLWLGWGGTVIQQKQAHTIFTSTTRERLGVGINPHLLRDCAATDVAVNSPAEVRLATSLLGHRLLRTTERHYNQARQRDAGERWQKTVLERRRQALRRRRKDPA